MLHITSQYLLATEQLHLDSYELKIEGWVTNSLVWPFGHHFHSFSFSLMFTFPFFFSLLSLLLSENKHLLRTAEGSSARAALHDWQFKIVLICLILSLSVAPSIHPISKTSCFSCSLFEPIYSRLATPCKQKVWTVSCMFDSPALNTVICLM